MRCDVVDASSGADAHASVGLRRDLGRGGNPAKIDDRFGRDEPFFERDEEVGSAPHGDGANGCQFRRGVRARFGPRVLLKAAAQVSLVTAAGGPLSLCMPRGVRGILVRLVVHDSGENDACDGQQHNAGSDGPTAVRDGRDVAILMLFHRLLKVQFRSAEYNSRAGLVVQRTMRRFLILAFLALAASACAPRVNRGPAPVIETGPEIVLAGGPEGESPAPSGPSAAISSRRPSLVTAAKVPSPRIAAAIEKLRDRDLVIPVAGADPSRIGDTFADGRDGGERQHNAVDIFAPRNTPIVSVDDGVILRMSTNSLGGITIYTTDRDRDFVYYYAHLDHYQTDMVVGRSIRKGDTLGFVGTTGNAPRDVPHLHFQIMLWPDDGKWWSGEPVNPYPVFRHAGTSGAPRVRFD